VSLYKSSLAGTGASGAMSLSGRGETHARLSVSANLTDTVDLSDKPDRGAPCPKETLATDLLMSR
jgi:hypothetical protein